MSKQPSQRVGRGPKPTNDRFGWKADTSGYLFRRDRGASVIRSPSQLTGERRCTVVHNRIVIGND